MAVPPHRKPWKESADPSIHRFIRERKRATRLKLSDCWRRWKQSFAQLGRKVNRLEASRALIPAIAESLEEIENPRARLYLFRVSSCPDVVRRSSRSFSLTRSSRQVSMGQSADPMRALHNCFCSKSEVRIAPFTCLRGFSRCRRIEHIMTQPRACVDFRSKTQNQNQP